MKRGAAVAAMLALLAMPAMAQHGGARGGFGGHATSGGFSTHGGFGGGFASHAGGFASHGGGFAPHTGGFAPRFGGFAPRYGGFAPRGGDFRPQGFAPRGFPGLGRTGYANRFGAGMDRAPYRGNEYERGGNGWAREGGDHHRDHHRMPYYNGFNGYASPYNYGAYPWYPIDLDPWVLSSDWDDSDDNSDNSAQAENGGYDSAPYPNYGEQEPAYGEPGAEYGEPAPEGYAAPQPYAENGPEQYQPQPAPYALQRPRYADGTNAARSQEAVTIIFNNGHAPEKIRNYMLTANTLTVLDDHYQQIPISQIDVAATDAANRAEGINFQVPGS